MFKSQAIKDLEDKIYDKIAKEIEDGDIQKGLWTRAKAQSNGDENQVESIYIKLRFDQLKEKSVAQYDEKVKQEQVQRQKEEAERVKREAEIKDEEKKKKKLGAGFSAFVWVFSFIIILTNLDWAKSIGFESSEESNDALMELLMYSAAHIISIPFVLMRGSKIDRQRRYVGENLKIYTSSFNIRLALVFVFIGIIVWMISPIFTSEPREDASVFINDVIQGTSNSENQELVSLIRELYTAVNNIEKDNLPNSNALVESDYLEYSSYRTLESVRNIKNLSKKASEEQLELPRVRTEVVSKFATKIENSSLNVEEKEALTERVTKPLPQETKARIDASYAYYQALYNLYAFLEIKYNDYTLKTDNAGGFEISFASNSNTSQYNNLVDQIDIKADTLNQAVAKENTYLESVLNSSGIDMSAEEFQAQMFGN